MRPPITMLPYSTNSQPPAVHLPQAQTTTPPSFLQANPCHQHRGLRPLKFGFAETVVYPVNSRQMTLPSVRLRIHGKDAAHVDGTGAGGAILIQSDAGIAGIGSFRREQWLSLCWCVLVDMSIRTGEWHTIDAGNEFIHSLFRSDELCLRHEGRG